MYGAISLAAVIFATTLPVFSGLSRAMPGVTSACCPSTSRVRPAIAENGTDAVSFPFPANLTMDINYPPAVAFAPDGSAFFVGFFGLAERYYLVRLSPGGTYTETYFPNVTPFNGILYADGDLWAPTESGIERETPDGNRYRSYDLTPVGAHLAVAPSGLFLGPDDAIYGGLTVETETGSEQGEIFRLDLKAGGITRYAVPVQPYGAFAFDSERRLYFGATVTSQSGAVDFRLARLETNGSTTILKVPISEYDRFNGIGSMLSVRGSIYFTAGVKLPNRGGENIFGRIAQDGSIALIPTPPGLYGPAYASQDRGGNIWFADTSFVPDPGTNMYYSYLYQYNTYTGHTNGPYAPTLLNDIFYGPYVGPDDNVWFVNGKPTGFGYGAPAGLSAYVRQVQRLQPASLSLAAGGLGSFAIMETHFNGPWTAVSQSPAVATVSPASSATGDFSVHETGPGVTSIAVTDRLGNVSYELVTAQ
jgi:hypothetical protein